MHERFKRKNEIRINHMIDLFDSLRRPDSFKEAYGLCGVACGQYEAEAKALWDIIKMLDLKSIVEIGRCLSGNSYLMACAAPNLERFLSLDIADWRQDEPMQKWFDYHGIKANIEVGDSLEFEPWGEWDFVYIDGGHTESIVTSDINSWKDRTKYIGFHDFADKNGKNKHKRYYKGVVEAIQTARDENGWQQIGKRARSEVVFEIKK